MSNNLLADCAARGLVLIRPQNMERGRFRKLASDDASAVWLWNQASPSPTRLGEGESNAGLLKNDLFNLTFPRRNFFLLPIRKIDDHMIWLLWCAV